MLVLIIVNLKHKNKNINKKSKYKIPKFHFQAIVCFKNPHQIPKIICVI